MKIYFATIGEGGNSEGQIFSMEGVVNRLMSYSYIRSSKDFIYRHLAMYENTRGGNNAKDDGD